MSKLGHLGRFFIKVGKIAPAILALTPLAVIAVPLTAAIQEAEALKGSQTGVEKLARVKNIALDAVAAINTKAGHQVVDPVDISASIDSAVSTVISAVNAVKD